MGNALIRGGTVVLPDSEPFRGDIRIVDGRVEALGAEVQAPTMPEIRADDCFVLPGFVDPHLHLGNFTPFANDCETESRAAARGGVTTVLTHVKALRHGNSERSYLPILDEVRQDIAQRSLIDVGIHLALSTEQHIQEIPAYYSRGVRSFKFYMGYRGDERARTRGSIGVSDGFILRAMTEIGRLPGAWALVHCENDELARDVIVHKPYREASEFLEWAHGRPPIVESEAVQRATMLAAAAHCPFYIVHLSCRQSLRVVRRMRASEPSPIRVEANLHHLIFSEDEAAQLEPSSLAKVYPPIRSTEDREALWEALRSGEVDTVATDHCCIDYARKLPGAMQGDPGFPTLDCFAPVFVTAALARGLSLRRIVDLTATNSARIFGLYPNKGTLLPGSDGDAIVIKVGEAEHINAADNLSASKFSPYDGRFVNVKVIATLRRGDLVFSRHDGPAAGPGGALVLGRAEIPGEVPTYVG